MRTSSIALAINVCYAVSIKHTCTMFAQVCSYIVRFWNRADPDPRYSLNISRPPVNEHVEEDKPHRGVGSGLRNPSDAGSRFVPKFHTLQQMLTTVWAYAFA